MKKLLLSFLRCGLIGWCLEISFTSMHSFHNKDFTLKGFTSLWMFPIYGMACFFEPIFRIIKNKHILFRGSFYTLCIFAMEFLSGTLLGKRDLCPWNYAQSKWSINGVIRLDYAPFWFATGLLYEITHRKFGHKKLSKS